MKRHRLAILAAMLAIGCAWAPTLLGPGRRRGSPAITARVHGTFVDKAGGLGVLSGDMTVVRFEVRSGTVTAVGRIVGSLADSAGNVLGQVDQELALPVGNVASTCNQLRMDLAATDADVLQTLVHFDGEVAGFDSREERRRRRLACCARQANCFAENRRPRLWRARWRRSRSQ